MIRSLIIIFNVFIALFLKLVAGGPTASVKVPASVKAGESFLVEVNIQTNGETKFMRYSMLLPDGWSAEQVANDGGVFNFASQNATVKWYSVDGKSELKISFRVTVPANQAAGNITLTNKISHPVDNKNANIDLDPVIIMVTSDSAATTYNNTHSVPDSTAKPPAEISIERVVPTEPVSGSFIVTITIHKEEMVSFGKIEDTLPSGFTATLVKSDGADFKFENGVARFGWYAGMPKKTTLNVQYKVTISPDMSGNQPISGHFSYVENEKGKVVNVSTSLVYVKPKDVVVQNTTNTTDNNSTSNTGNTTSNTDNSSTGNTDNSSTAKSGNTTSNTDNNSSSNSGNTASNSNSGNNPDTAGITSHSVAKSASIVFKVQVAAMLNKLPASYFPSKFNISDPIVAELDGGLTKYLTGNFSTYQEARDDRNMIRSKGVNDAFVTAYNNGKRVTVQEALMITSQKWVL